MGDEEDLVGKEFRTFRNKNFIFPLYSNMAGWRFLIDENNTAKLTINYPSQSTASIIYKNNQYVKCIIYKYF